MQTCCVLAINPTRPRGVIKKLFYACFHVFLLTDCWDACNSVICHAKLKCLPHLLRDLTSPGSTTIATGVVGSSSRHRQLVGSPLCDRIKSSRWSLMLLTLTNAMYTYSIWIRLVNFN